MTDYSNKKRHDLALVDPSTTHTIGFNVLRKGATPVWNELDGDYLTQLFHSGAADMTAMNPEEEIHLIQDNFAAGFGKEIYDPNDPKRYHVSNGMDFRNGQGILGWGLTAVTKPTAINLTVNTTGWDMNLAANSGTDTSTNTNVLGWATGVEYTVTATVNCTFGGTGTAKIGINDGVGTTYGATTSSNGVTVLTATRTIDSAATQFGIVLSLTDDGPVDPSTAAFSGVSVAPTGGTLTVGTTTSHATFNDAEYASFGALLGKLNAGGTKFDLLKGLPATITALVPFQVSGTDYLFIFLGTSNSYWYMTTAEAFTESTAVVKTFQFGAWVNTTVDTLYANDGVNTVRSTTNPLNGGTAWSAQTVVGDAANAITHLQENSGALLIDKEDMPYYLDSTGAVKKDLAPECISGASTHSGKNSTTWQGEYFRPTGSQALLRIGTTNEWIQPSKFGTNISAFAGQVEAVCGDEEYLYCITDNSTKVEILAGREDTIDDVASWRWHPIQELTLTGCETAWISTVYKKRLWISSTSSSDSLYYLPLPTKYGDIVNDTNASFLTGGTAETPWLHANFKSTNKAHIDLTLVMGHTYNANVYITVKYKLLGGSWSAGVNYAGTASSMTQTQYLAAASTSRTSTMIKFQFTGVTNSTSLTPILLSYDSKAVLFPTIKKVYQTVIRTGGRNITDKEGGNTGNFYTLQNNCLANCRNATSWITGTEYLTSPSGTTFYCKFLPIPQSMGSFKQVIRYENNEPTEWEYNLLMMVITLA